MVFLELRRDSRVTTGNSHEYSGLISFRIDLFDLLAEQGTLKRQEDMIIYSTMLSCPAKII